MDKNDQRKLTKVLENFDLREGGEGGIGLHVDNAMTMQLVTMQLDRLVHLSLLSTFHNNGRLAI